MLKKPHMKTVLTALLVGLAFEVVLVALYFLSTEVMSLPSLGIPVVILHLPALGLVEHLTGQDNWLALFLVMWFIWFLLFAFVLEIISRR